MRLGPATLAALPFAIARPRYDRSLQKTGIVHFGIGAFHRAHQAVYTDDAMNAGGRDWGIVGVSLRSPDVAMQLNPQDGLYTVSERGPGAAPVRVIGAVGHVLVAAADGERLAAAIAAPATHILSFTITEKGYARTAGGELDAAHPAVANDLAGKPPRSVYGHLEAGLRRRRDAGAGGVTLLSCDNLVHNGAVFGALLATYLDARDPALARWVGDRCTTPSTMVDRIVPATTAADRAGQRDAMGVEDAAMVVTEPFRQWVIEDRFAGPRPTWEAGGAQFVVDVEPFETAKLRILNGTHSALAYLGIERGHVFVHEAIRDPQLRPVIEAFMREATASLDRPPPDVAGYAQAILARLANAALPYRLEQIATDGSQKISQRWLKALSGRSAEALPATIGALAAWVRFTRRNAPRSGPDGIPTDQVVGHVRRPRHRTGVVRGERRLRGALARLGRRSCMPDPGDR